MIVQFTPSALGESKWYEYVVRFLFGALITALAGMIAKTFGPELGGLFLAFPAIFPASATLIEKHVRQEKEQLGLHGSKVAAAAVSVDSAGAATGSIALGVFGIIVWQAMPNHSVWSVLTAAIVAWLAVSVLLWLIRKRTFAGFIRWRSHCTQMR